MRIPATVVTGFLGSGKTTLLNHLLRNKQGLRVAVIVNELGEIGIDGQVTLGAEEFVELDNGCLCCALNADLDKTLQALHARGGFEHLVIETTGAADPIAIGWIFSRPHLSKAYRLDAIVTVVDALHVQQVMQDMPEARVQLSRADIVVLNKLDLVTDGGQQAQQHVRAINDIAPILETHHGEIPWELLLTGGESTFAQAPEHHHTVSMQSYVYQPTNSIDEEALDALLVELPESVFRVKGLVQSPELGWLYVNVVGGRVDMTQHVGPTPRGAALVFIGKTLNKDALQKVCSAAFESHPTT